MRNLMDIRLILGLILVSGFAGAGHTESSISHAVTIHDTPKYGPDFKHFDYVNPAAPKGGTVKLATIGSSFDSLNPFILKGIAATAIANTFDTLTVSSLDEPNTAYGLVAETIEIAADGTWVQFHLRDFARFHDGSPITPADVKFSFDIIRSKGHPFFQAYYADVVASEVVDENTVKFSFKDGSNHELPAILGQLPVLSKTFWQDRAFDQTSLEPALGSGPYRVAGVDPGRSISYERVKDYWARDLPVQVGQFNFDNISFEYYRDETIALEAFKAGDYDFRAENTAKLWATGYDGPALQAGLIKQDLIPHSNPAGMQGFIFNTRRSFFQDPRVRQAIAHTFDFEWTNNNFFYGQYSRSKSYFSNSELAATGLPGPEELAILENFRGKIPDEVFTRSFEPPVSDASGNIRSELRTALDLLRQAGWTIENQTLIHQKTGERFAFEMLLVQPGFERIVLPMKTNLKKLGIEMSVRTVDSVQYKKRRDDFDFDMTVGNFGLTLSPGNEQRDYWHSGNAELPGSRNHAGAADPAIDGLIELIVGAPDRTTLVNTTRAFDRVLLWNHFVIPNWHINSYRVAYWAFLRRPSVAPKYGLGFDTWWADGESQKRIAREKKTD